MSKIFFVTSLIIGTVIGAGFASGREIIAFFGETPSPFVAIPCAILISLFCAVFLFVGKKVNANDMGEVNRALFGKGETVATSFTLFNSVVSFSAMLAGFDALFNQVLSLAPLYSCVLAVVSSIVVSRGIDGLYKANAILVPLLTIFIIVVTSSSINLPVTPAFTASATAKSVWYIAMNGMLTASVLTTIKGLTNEEIIISSVVTGVIVGTLIAIIVLALNSQSFSSLSSLPLVTLAHNISPVFYAISIFIVSAGIFTTALTAHASLVVFFKSFIKSKFFAVTVPTVFCLALSFLGFEKVVDIFYPAVGVVGLIYFVVCLIYLTEPLKWLSQKRNQRVHKRSKNA